MAPIQSGIKRRHFLKALGAALAGVSAAKVLPASGKSAHAGVRFDSRAFELRVPPLDFKARYIDPAVQSLTHQIDYDAMSRAYNRLDVLLYRLDGQVLPANRWGVRR